jgi:CsoR family transcriptional regulator, copper-sensing transcriptional repressor
MTSSAVRTSHSYAADKLRILTRLRRIEGQARGLAKMVEEDRYCIDIMQQIASLRAAADAVALVLLRDHLDGCVREAVLGGGGAEKIDEVVEAVRRYSRS